MEGDGTMQSWELGSTMALADALVTRALGWLAPPAPAPRAAVSWATAASSARQALTASATQGATMWAWRMVTRM